ncbi:hypothetical protein E4T47_04520 [Aureobasidium subglaciale]|nr:hypothetical protein E4T47_04520 [Aureobasidium subglaciale]
MRFSSYAPLALAANLAAAMPRPQEIDFDIVFAAPDPTFTEAVGITAQSITINTEALIASATAAISSVAVDITDVLSATAVVQAKRAAATCVKQAPGATSVPDFSGDTAAQFLAEPYFASVASANAAAPTGYTQAFVNKQASNNAFGYLGFVTMDTYDVNQCATQCTAKYGCSSFNIYFERDPSVDPNDASCSDPAAVTMIKCVMWSGQVTAANAVNVGQSRGGFSVAIAGNNGYVTNKISTPNGFQTGVPFGKFAMNAPYDAQGYNTYMGAKMFTGNWDVTQCSEYCKAQTTYNKNTAPKDGTPYKACRFFNTYLLQVKKADGTIVPQGQYCSLYTEAWPAKYAVNSGSWQGKDQYTIDYSFGFSMTDAGIDPTVGDSNGAKYQAVADIKWSSLQPFCSAYLGYTTPLSTVTATATITPVVTSTSYSTTTVAPMRKRDDTDSLYPGLSMNSSVGALAVIDANGTKWYNPNITAQGPDVYQMEKRDVSVAIPAGLAKYQPAVVSAACSMQVKPASYTSILTNFATVTGAASTTVVSVVSTATSAPPVDNLVLNIAGSSNNPASSGPLEFVNRANPPYGVSNFPYINMRNVPNYASLVRKTGFYIESSTGYLKDNVGGGRTAAVYARVGSGSLTSINFLSAAELATNIFHAPLICTVAAALPSEVKCSVKSSDGLILKDFVGIGHINDYSYFYMSQLNQDSYYGKTTLTLSALK